MSPETQESPPDIEPLIHEPRTYAQVTEQISGIVLTHEIRTDWLLGLSLGLAALTMLALAVMYLFVAGVGIWGIDIPVAWGFAIANFVWWIGIGHAGTLISAILLLMRQHWRKAINRFAEAMTLFAVSCAGLFPLLHLGRPYYFYYLFPYPNTQDIWPQFRSPLIWDVFAVSTYFTVSLVFWYVGLIPDLATLRDRARAWVPKVLFGALALGWRNSARHWQRYETAYLLLAGLATPLVVSVHTVVSWDFAVALVPGWHTTIFPPYFVAGAIFSGFAMVLTLGIILRKMYHLENLITTRHLDAMGKITLATGLIVSYGYLMENFISWYGQDPYDEYMTHNRMFGPYAPFYWTLIVCNVLLIQLLWFKRIRTSALAMFIISLGINVGMWMERFVIVVTSLHRDFTPSAWGMYYPTVWDYATLVGSLGLFVTAFYLFIRVLPMISMFEMRQLVDEYKKPEEARIHG